MQKQNDKQEMFVGLDVGTDSVGYAVTDGHYNLLKFKGEPMWGVHLFEGAGLANERRGFRVGRRRFDRRRQRVRLLQELFAADIADIDPDFFIRIKESALYPEDSHFGVTLFNDSNYTDVDYYSEYPTIHHLISELIENPHEHDVRLVYLACVWLVVHRGHFLSEISKDNLMGVLDIGAIYDDFEAYFGDNLPWARPDLSEFGRILESKQGEKRKSAALKALLFANGKLPKDGFLPNRELLIKLLSGGKVSAQKLFDNAEYAEISDISLDKNDEDLAPVLAALGDDAELILQIKALYDWSVLSGILQGEQYISKAKVAIYEQHKRDLHNLKYLLSTYLSEKYDTVFRLHSGNNYVAYVDGIEGKKGKKQIAQAEFCKFVLPIIKEIVPNADDKNVHDEVLQRAELALLCPKQVNPDNRVIPHQVYWAELKKILDNAEKYLPFLCEVSDGISCKDKILSIFEFRVPYFVGPLNEHSQFAWLKRKAEGKIYPWNFEDKVDLDASEQAFIDRMTNSCTYLPDADVLPKNSLCYERFELLNELNCLTVSGERLSAGVKQCIYNDLFDGGKRVTKKAIAGYLLSNNFYTADELLTLAGVDDVIKSRLATHKSFAVLLQAGVLDKDDAERIIERRAYCESKERFAEWLAREYPDLTEKDRAYIAGLKLKDFGRLSRRLLCEIYGIESEGEQGEPMSILERMWAENVNLNEILSKRYTYAAQIEEIRKQYFAENKQSLTERLDEMYVSNAVKRPIIRAMSIVEDIVKARGKNPDKIFVEMARGAEPTKKGKKTLSRHEQLLALYEQCDSQDVRLLYEELNAMGEADKDRLQSDKLFLYYLQLGKCMYTGRPIRLSDLAGDRYNIDHIYPQSKVKDDSVWNNKVLVESELNGNKKDDYPISAEIRHSRAAWWKMLHEKKLINDEKYKRLTRNTPFSESEQWSFINRQLVETRQSTKVLAALLQERYPDSRIVYVKAGLVSEFRQEFDLLKCRTVNDLHHAKDAYLNIVVGNVYNERFTRQWFLENRDKYNLKVKTLFGKEKVAANGVVLWEGASQLAQVKNLVQNKNAIHLTRYALSKRGKLFDVMPLKKGAGLVPRKANLPAEKYGGYNGTAAAFYMLAKFRSGKKNEVMLVPVELMFAERVMADESFAEEYIKGEIGKIIGKAVSELEFPLGMRQIKIGTMFEFDRSMRLCLNGKNSGGSMVIMSVISPLLVGYRWEKYIKHIERFVEKKSNNEDLIYSEEYDKISTAENTELYDILLEKLQSEPYRRQPANPAAHVLDGREKFTELDVFEQAKCLLQILIIFNRTNLCDLSAIGASKNSGVVRMNAKLSNWQKEFSEARILDMSPSGLYVARSLNLLDLL